MIVSRCGKLSNALNCKKPSQSFVSTVECEVIALCLFPVVQTFDWAGPVGPSNIISKESFQNVKKDLYDHFNLPTFVLGEEAQMMDLTNEIISYFSQES